jgi:hypothetical protein
MLYICLALTTHSICCICYTDKQEFYGKSNNPFEKAVNKHGHTSFHVHKTGDVAVGIGIDQDGSVESSLVDAQEPVSPQAARRAAQAAMQKVVQRNDMINSSLYQQAASMRNNGHYHVDDYSFSTINIHNIPKDNVGSPKRNDGSNNRSLLKMPKWMESFAPSVANSKYNPPEYGNITRDTNLAPPIRGNHQDWWSNSPKVTFDTDHPDKRSKWSSLSHSQKVGAGVIWVALMCTLMGVTVWSLNKPPQEVYGGDRSSSLTGFVPGAVPTLNPTDRPTRPPVSRSPVSGYSSLHGKGSDTSPRPSRSPITSRPSNSPVVSPTSSPSSSPTSMSPTAPPNSCTDDAGYFLNHLMNPKDCYWLWNEKDGYTDRKDKNCGTALYPQTDLGSACRATCKEYNGCITDMTAVSNEVAANENEMIESISSTPESASYESISFRSDVTTYLTPSQVQGDASTAQMCSDVNDRTFKNHLNSDKTCEWLDNDKPGQTERKDKNCGYGSYPITELGLNCPQTCIWYNKSGCSAVPMKRSIEPNLRAASTSSTGCVNGSGKYENHHGQHKQCQWLHEPDSPNIEKFRQDKNCGTDDHPITDLGTKCPWSCKDYNGCSELRD